MARIAIISAFGSGGHCIWGCWPLPTNEPGRADRPELGAASRRQIWISFASSADSTACISGSNGSENYRVERSLSKQPKENGPTKVAAQPGNRIETLAIFHAPKSQIEWAAVGQASLQAQVDISAEVIVPRALAKSITNSSIKLKRWTSCQTSYPERDALSFEQSI